MKILKLFILLLVITSALYMYLSAQSSTTFEKNRGQVMNFHFPKNKYLILIKRVTLSIKRC